MTMYLAGIPVFTIMLLDCWSSNAFLRYIRKQVKEFSHGVSSKMIQNEKFFTIQNTSANRSLNNAPQPNHGPNFGETIRL